MLLRKTGKRLCTAPRAHWIVHTVVVCPAVIIHPFITAICLPSIESSDFVRHSPLNRQVACQAVRWFDGNCHGCTLKFRINWTIVPVSDWLVRLWAQENTCAVWKKNSCEGEFDQKATGAEQLAGKAPPKHQLPHIRGSTGPKMLLPESGTLTSSSSSQEVGGRWWGSQGQGWWGSALPGIQSLPFCPPFFFSCFYLFIFHTRWVTPSALLNKQNELFFQRGLVWVTPMLQKHLLSCSYVVCSGIILMSAVQMK